jgi:hypothetical protein
MASFSFSGGAFFPSGLGFSSPKRDGRLRFHDGWRSAATDSDVTRFGSWANDLREACRCRGTRDADREIAERDRVGNPVFDAEPRVRIRVLRKSNQ